MSAHLSEVTRATCDAYSRAMSAGEAQQDVIGYLANQYDVQRPAIWKRLRAGGLIPEYGSHVDGKRIGRNAAGILDRRPKIDAEPHVVDRDPCPRCGVRGDVGCKHGRAPVGTAFGMCR